MKGSPQAQQVADRWHLLKNLRESVQTEIERRHRRLTWVVSPEATPLFALPTPGMSQARERASQTQKRTARLARYEQVIALHAKGYTHHQIIATVGLSHRTITRYKKQGVFPERAVRRPNTQQILDPFLPALEQRWHEGCKNAAQLYRELITQGFQGSYGIVADHVRRLRHGQPARRELPHTTVATASHSLTPCQTSWLLVQTSDSLNEAQRQDLTGVLHHYPELAGLQTFVSDFVEMVQKRTGRHLTEWLQRVEQSPYLALHTFAKGIQRDEIAVQAGLSVEWSNGQVEGQVNRLKMIKRQMYGRATFDLLRQRVLMRL